MLFKRNFAENPWHHFIYIVAAERMEFKSVYSQIIVYVLNIYSIFQKLQVLEYFSLCFLIILINFWFTNIAVLFDTFASNFNLFINTSFYYKFQKRL